MFSSFPIRASHWLGIYKIISVIHGFSRSRVYKIKFKLVYMSFNFNF